jgi:hypothetical protein
MGSGANMARASRDRLHNARRLLRQGRYNIRNHRNWEQRSMLAADMAVRHGLKSGARVADIGAGPEPMRRLLEERGLSTAYDSFDIEPQHAGITRLDISVEGLPGHYDVAFCLGLFEYVRDPAVVFRRVFASADEICHSYVTRDRGQMSLSDRTRTGWVSHLTGDEIEAIARSVGMQCVERCAFGVSDMWWWRARA